MDWIPVKGGYLYNYPTNRIMIFDLECVNRYGKKEIGAIDRDGKMYWFPKNNFRPATLDDFAVEIPDYEKVWFVKIPGFRTAAFNKGNSRFLVFNTLYPSDEWILAALIAHYRITVMPQKLWDKLTKDGKDETD